LLAPRIPRQTARLGDADLVGDPPGDDGRDVGRVREERAEEPHRRELDRESEPVVIAAPLGDQLAVALIEEKRTARAGAPTAPLRSGRSWRSARR